MLRGRSKPLNHAFPASQSTTGREHKDLKFETRSLESEPQWPLKTPSWEFLTKHRASYGIANTMRTWSFWLYGLRITRIDSWTWTPSTCSFQGLFYRCVKRSAMAKLRGWGDLNHPFRNFITNGIRRGRG
jgi:hypothetical protein